jgi:hypothetical protein
MKHFILLPLLALGLYFTWSYLPRISKNRARKFSRKHLAVIVSVVLAALAGLVVQFNLISTRIL